MKNKKMNPLLLDVQLCFALYTASRLVIKAYDPYLKDLDITYPQYLVFLVLWETNSMSVKDIGERLQLDSGTLSPLLKKLEAKGLVERVRSEFDERVVMVALTEKGSQLQNMAKKIPEKMVCDFKLQDKDIMNLRDDLKDLIKNLSE